jgi:hypothetical protein
MTKANNVFYLYICMHMPVSISVQSRRAEERQTNLACMMMDSSGRRPDLCSHGKQACIWDTRIQKG